MRPRELSFFLRVHFLPGKNERFKSEAHHYGERLARFPVRARLLSQPLTAVTATSAPPPRTFLQILLQPPAQLPWLNWPAFLSSSPGLPDRQRNPGCWKIFYGAPRRSKPSTS